MEFCSLLKRILQDQHLTIDTAVQCLSQEAALTALDGNVIEQWLAGSEIPTFKEQVCVCLALGMPFQTLLLNLTLPPQENAFIQPLKQLFPAQSQYTSLSYIPSYHSPRRLKLHDNVSSKTQNIIEKYYEHFDVYRNKALHQLLQNKSATHTLCVLQPHYKVPNSHLCYSFLTQSLPIHSLGLIIPAGNILLHPAYFNGIAELIHLMGWFVINIAKDRTLDEIRDTQIYSMTRDAHFSPLYQQLQSELLYQSPQGQPYMAMYKTSLFNILTNANLLHFSKEINARLL